MLFGPFTFSPWGWAPFAIVLSSQRLSCAAVTLLLVACMHSPDAATQALGLRGGDAEPASAAGPACQEAVQARSAMARASHELQAVGLGLQVTCSTAGGGWMVQVRVLDGVKASKVVRGPLADGQEVDMGTPAGAVLAGLGGLSPDVQYNRQWLRAFMARHQFDKLPDGWWHFAQRGSVPARAASADLVSR